MKENIYRTLLLTRVTRALTIVLGSIIWICALPAYAEDGDGHGDIIENGCMQDVAGFELGCTANDVRVSGVADVTDDGIVNEDDITFAPVCDATASNAGADCSLDSSICLNGDGLPDSDLCGDKCAYPGDTTQFSATFIFELSAQQRYDVGAYFEVLPDEDSDDGALTGTCQIVTLPEDGTEFIRPDDTTGSFVDLDSTCKGGSCPQEEDLCGDIDDDNNPIYYDMKGAKATPDYITAQCVDPDGDGNLNLPNCTSWRQSGANDVCLNGSDAFPGAPSKCNCDPNFQVPINVPPATITVDKAASPTSVDESSDGTPVKYTVEVTNNSPFAVVTIYTLTDDKFGDITSVHGLITSTTCSVTDPTTGDPLEIDPGKMYDCYFMATIAGQGNDEHKNTVTASGEDDYGNPMEDSDDATVAINNVPFNFDVDKSASDDLPEPGGEFTFTVTVTNLSTADKIVVSALNDDKYGDITSTDVDITSTNCAVPQSLEIKGELGDSYSCSFTVTEIHNAGWSHTNTVTAWASDEESEDEPRTNSATINITNVDSSISVTKTADPTTFNEPLGVITYDIVVVNTSETDVVYIESLNDTILGDVTTTGHDGITSTTCSASALEPQILLAHDKPETSDIVEDTYSCEVEVEHEVNGAGSITNTVTASGQDDDTDPVTGSDSETVTYIDVKPTATLVKEVVSMDVTYKVKVTNTSTAEALTLDSLIDDKFGDITILPGTCDDDISIPADDGSGSNIYECNFVGTVTSSPHVNTVTGTVSDDEDNSVTSSDSAEVTFKN